MNKVRVGPVVAVSLPAGCLVALGLVLGPFGGASEPVITGVILLAFAASFGALAGLSILATDQPQRWATVPAVTLGLIGASLLALEPAGPTIDSLGWIWPPFLLALSVSIYSGARRHLRSRARPIVIYPIVGVYALSALGGAYQTVSDAMDRREYALKGTMVDVKGRRMFLSCRGSGSPTVILESGLGESSAYWGWIAPKVAQETTVCAYDRAGRGGSDEASSPQDGVGVATDLYSLLARAHVTGPFVLVGHSSGAQYVRIFAGRYPAEVTGVVLLDPQPAEALTRLPTFPRFYRIFRTVSALLPSLARLGVTRWITPHLSSSTLPTAAQEMQRASSSSARSARSLRDEFAQLPIALEQAGSFRSLGDVPLVVVTAARDAMPGWLPLQDTMAALSRNSLHRVLPNATHGSLIENELDAGASIQAIRDVVGSLRTGRPLQGSRMATAPDLTQSHAARLAQ